MKAFYNLKLLPLQCFGVILLSLNFWYSGVLLVSTISYYLAWSLSTLSVLTILGYPIAVISIRGVNYILRLRPDQSRGTVSIITMAVTIMHLIALARLANWYHVAGTELILAMVWLLIFSLTVLLTSYIKSRQPVKPLQ